MILSSSHFLLLVDSIDSAFCFLGQNHDSSMYAFKVFRVEKKEPNHPKPLHAVKFYMLSKLSHARKFSASEVHESPTNFSIKRITLTAPFLGLAT